MSDALIVRREVIDGTVTIKSGESCIGRDPIFGATLDLVMEDDAELVLL